MPGIGAGSLHFEGGAIGPWTRHILGSKIHFLRGQILCYFWEFSLFCFSSSESDPKSVGVYGSHAPPPLSYTQTLGHCSEFSSVLSIYCIGCWIFIYYVCWMSPTWQSLWEVLCYTGEKIRSFLPPWNLPSKAGLSSRISHNDGNILYLHCPVATGHMWWTELLKYG